MELTNENALERMDAAVAALAAAPREPGDSGSGRGVVICGGGLKYFTCAWVCVHMLRRVGCTLPVELWHLGEREMTPDMRELIEPLDVRCVDALEVRKVYPARRLNGWELKPYAIIHSRFREVLSLDADNVPIVDPTFLFETPQYAETGALFWPDYGRLPRSRMVWGLTGVPYRDEPEFESGQIVVDKARCWDPLALTMWMNEHSDFWYHHIHGDKETFHMAWRKLDRPYAMPNRGILGLMGTMCQHDFRGRRIFQHRNLRKWTLEGNPYTPGFEFEHVCIQILEQLRAHQRVLRGFPKFQPELAGDLSGARVDYHRVGYDRRFLTLGDDGRIGTGANRMERFWGVRRLHGRTVMEIFGDDGTTARLLRDPTEPLVWRGRWLIHEQMPLEISVAPPAGDTAVPAGGLNTGVQERR